MEIPGDKNLTNLKLNTYEQEYAAIPAEILTWIIKYSLISISASVPAISLSIFNRSDHWTWFFASIISIIGCLGFLTSHANAKIAIAASFIASFHSEKTKWDHLFYDKLKGKIMLATAGYVIPLAGLCIILLVAVLVCPAILHDSFTLNGLITGYPVLILPLLFYVMMIVTIWSSGRRAVYKKIGLNFITTKNQWLITIKY